MELRPLLFLGHVMHKRLRPKLNAFVYPVFYVRLPLRRLGEANRGIFSIDRWNLLSFCTKDHGPRNGKPLLPWIAAQLREHGLPTEGEILLQTFPRVLGYVFNPVSFWYCHDMSGQLIAILAEVNNTFGDTHSYLLHRHGQALRDGDVFQAEKAFHVSPFNEVEGGYRFRFRLEGNVTFARIDYDDADGELLQTSISGKPQAWTLNTLTGALLRMPFMTFGVMARIHWQAMKLWLKGVTFHGSHPTSHRIKESTK